MINGKKEIKELLNKKELNILYEIGISKKITLSETIIKLENYIEKLGYVTLDEEFKDKSHKIYFDILNKCYDIAPVY